VAGVVLIRGPLGIGKTTVARAAAAALDAAYVSVDAILEAHDLEVWEDGYISLGSFLRANDVAVGEVNASLAAGRSVVVDGNFYWPEAIADLARRVAAPVWVVSLAGPVELCLERDAGRARPFGPESVHAVYAKSTAFPAGRAVDARRPVDELVETVRGLLASDELSGARSRDRPGDGTGSD